jgi:hypothetical protein
LSKSILLNRISMVEFTSHHAKRGNERNSTNLPWPLFFKEGNRSIELVEMVGMNKKSCAEKIAEYRKIFLAEVNLRSLKMSDH